MHGYYSDAVKFYEYGVCAVLGEKIHEKRFDEIRIASRGYVMPPLTLGCVCQFLYTLYVNVEQFGKKTLGMEKMYDTRFVIMVVGIMTAAMMIMNILYQWNYVRYGIIMVYSVIILAAGWKNREFLMSKIKR